MKPWHVVVGVGALSLVGVGWFAFRALPQAPTAVAGQGAPAVGPPEPLPPPTGAAACALKPGVALSYAYDSRTRFSFAPGLVQVSAPGESRFTAGLTVAPLRAEAGATTVLARFTGVNEEVLQAVGESVTSGFLFKLDARCEVTAVARHRSTRRAAARAQQAALYELWFSTDTGDGQLVTNAQGQAQLRMARGAEVDLVRSTVAYASFWSPALAEARLAESSARIVLGDSGWFETLTSVEALTGGSLESSRTEVVARRVAATPEALPDLSRNLEDYVWENVLSAVELEVSGVGGSGDLPHAERVAQMKDVTFDEAMTRFETRLRSGENIASQWPDTAAFLDAHPEAIDDYVATITDAEFPRGWKGPAFVALGQVRNARAREALFEIYGDRAEAPMDRVRSSLALVTRRDVGAPLAQALRAEASRPPESAQEALVARQSLLHLGVLGGTHASDAELLAASRAAIEERLSLAREPADYSLVFHAMGNLADASLLPEIERWSRDPDAEIRAHAPKAIARYKAELVHDFTVEWLRRETSPDVKRELFHVIHQQYTDAGRPITEQLKTEALAHLEEQPLVMTRQSLLRLLGPLAATHGDVRRALERQLKTELESRSGLYSLVVSSLTPEGVLRGLAEVDGVRAQVAPLVVPARTDPPPLQPREPSPGFFGPPPTGLVVPPLETDGSP